MKARHLSRAAQQGLTLIELLIAMTLSAFILDGVIQTFLGARQSYRVQEGLSRLQENGRYAIEFIDRDVRMAGFRGCNARLSLAGANNHLAAAYITDFDTSLQAFEATGGGWTPAIDPSINAPDPGSDIITVRRASESGHNVTAHATAASNITLDSTAGLTVGDNVLIADCSHAEVFSITAIAGNIISHGGVLANSYPTGEVFPIATTSYYVKGSSLYRKVGGNAAQELIEQIENMQILYGEDTDMNVATGVSPDYAANYYVTADQVVNPRRVVSVRINLLVASPDDNVTAEKAGYTFNGANVAAAAVADHRIRRGFTTTIAIRNRLN